MANVADNASWRRIISGEISGGVTSLESALAPASESLGLGNPRDWVDPADIISKLATILSGTTSGTASGTATSDEGPKTAANQALQAYLAATPLYTSHPFVFNFDLDATVDPLRLVPGHMVSMDGMWSVSTPLFLPPDWVASIPRESLPRVTPSRRFSSIDEYANFIGAEKPIHKILIANSGMAAAKFIRSIWQWSYETFGRPDEITFVIMVTAQDLKANAEFIRLAATLGCEIELVPDGGPANNFSNVDLIVDIAQTHGVDAVWPGWGFASENPALPTRLDELGIGFIGPRARAMNPLGDKASALLVGGKAGMRIAPWSGSGLEDSIADVTDIPPEIYALATVSSADDAVRVIHEKEISVPFMFKAVFGGGGKGIRKLEKLIEDPATRDEEIRKLFKQTQAEVAGPVLIMAFIPNARHIELQGLADKHGQAIVLYERDCSTQKEFQKVIEEGPPIGLDQSERKKMRQSAVAAMKMVGYENAGTIENLYSTLDDAAFFLEVNPRLQVEHPVSEMITGVNLPVAQLHVEMGASLHRIPDIRRLYGEDPWGHTPIDFDNKDPLPPRGHVIAVRITARDPDRGWKASPGSAHEITFRNMPGVWGYTSFATPGGIHEFADSQFMHIFAHGETRDDAINKMAVALQMLRVPQFRTPSAAILQYLESDTFRKNSPTEATTTKLDELVASGGLVNQPEKDLSIVLAAAFKAHETMLGRQKEYQAESNRGHVPFARLLGTYFSVDVINREQEDTKYSFKVSYLGDGRYSLDLNGRTVEAHVLQVGPEAGRDYMIGVDGEYQLVSGRALPSGLQLDVGWKTVFFPKEYDPSKILAEAPGKFIRYLVPNGSEVKKGMPIIEYEAMKTISQIVALEDGKLSYTMSPNTGVVAGDLLGKVELAEPGKVKKAFPFTEKLREMVSPFKIGEGLRNQYEWAYNQARQILGGFGPDSGMRDLAGLVVTQLFTTLENPRLPVEQFVYFYSVYQGSLPRVVREQLRDLVDGYAAALDANPLPAFPSADILRVISEYEAGNQLATDAAREVQSLIERGDLREQDRDEKQAEILKAKQEAFKMAAKPFQELAENYREGLAGNRNRVLRGLFSEFTKVEQAFQGKTYYRATVELKRKAKEKEKDLTPEDKVDVHAYSQAHNEIYMWQDAEAKSKEDRPVLKRNIFIETLMQKVSETGLVGDLTGSLVQVKSLRGKAFDPLAHQAAGAILKNRQVGIVEGIRQVRSRILDINRARSDARPDLMAVLVSEHRSLFQLVVPHFFDTDPAVIDTALQVYVKRAYRGHEFSKLQTHGSRLTEGGETQGVIWNYRSVRATRGRDARFGSMMVFQNQAQLEQNWDGVWVSFREAPGAAERTLSLVLKEAPPGNERAVLAALQNMVSAHQGRLQSYDINRVSFIINQVGAYPAFYTFRKDLNWQEDVVVRHMEPALAYTLTPNRMSYFAVQAVPVPNHQIHLYYGREKVERQGEGTALVRTIDRKPIKDKDRDSRFFVRSVVRGAEVRRNGVGTEQVISVPRIEEVFAESLDVIEMTLRRGTPYDKTTWNQVFLNVSDPIDLETSDVAHVIQTIYDRNLSRLNELRVGMVEVRLLLKNGSDTPQPYLFVASNPSGHHLEVHGYEEITHPTTGKITYRALIPGANALDGKDRDEPYRPLDQIDKRRLFAQNRGQTYVYDIPNLIETALAEKWEGRASPPSELVSAVEMVVDTNHHLIPTDRPAGQNNVGMVAFKLTIRDPQFPEGREIIIAANDFNIDYGSFSEAEDEVYQKASEYARKSGLPFLYVAANSGARIGVFEELKAAKKYALNNPTDPAQGGYVYLTEAQYSKFAKDILAEQITVGSETRWKITGIKDGPDGIGVENLRGSGTIAGEASKAFDEGLTFTYVMGLNVGIGAYISRLNRRVIQKRGTAMMLTGKDMMNELMGDEYYTDNQEFGGVNIHAANGNTRVVVEDDVQGMRTFLDWISFMPKVKGGALPIVKNEDPVNRTNLWKPLGPEMVYDPRFLIRGGPTPVVAADGTIAFDGAYAPGFLDEGSFRETMEEWAKSVVTGRGLWGGIPVAVVTPELRSTQRVVPADAAMRASSERRVDQAGKVWWSDSAWKTAEFMADTRREGLPLVVLPNWRGFSGGVDNMFDHILKYGSFIVDELRQYDAPVMIMLPPFGELRGGAWVVVDPTINHQDQATFWAESHSRGNVLEAGASARLKVWGKNDDFLKAKMKECDEVMMELVARLAGVAADSGGASELRDQIVAREKILLPVYRSIAVQFADAHDIPERMLEKGVISRIVDWKDFRSEGHQWLARSVAFDQLRKALLQASGRDTGTGEFNLTPVEARENIRGWFNEDMDAKRATSVIAGEAPAERGNPSRTNDDLWKDNVLVEQWIHDNWVKTVEAGSSVETRTGLLAEKINEAKFGQAVTLMERARGILEMLPAEMRGRLSAAMGAESLAEGLLALVRTPPSGGGSPASAEGDGGSPGGSPAEGQTHGFAPTTATIPPAHVGADPSLRRTGLRVGPVTLVTAATVAEKLGWARHTMAGNAYVFSTARQIGISVHDDGKIIRFTQTLPEGRASLRQNQIIGIPFLTQQNILQKIRKEFPQVEHVVVAYESTKGNFEGTMAFYPNGGNSFNPMVPVQAGAIYARAGLANGSEPLPPRPLTPAPLPRGEGRDERDGSTTGRDTTIDSPLPGERAEPRRGEGEGVVEPTDKAQGSANDSFDLGTGSQILGGLSAVSGSNALSLAPQLVFLETPEERVSRATLSEQGEQKGSRGMQGEGTIQAARDLLEILDLSDLIGNLPTTKDETPLVDVVCSLDPDLALELEELDIIPQEMDLALRTASQAGNVEALQAIAEELLGVSESSRGTACRAPTEGVRAQGGNVYELARERATSTWAKARI